MYHCLYWIISGRPKSSEKTDRAVNPRKNTSGSTEEYCNIAARWWYWGTPRLGMVMSSFSLASALGLIAGWEERAFAQSQIVPDNTLGAETSQVVPNFNGLVEVINGGAIRGANLFHSFEEFNVAKGRGAYFFSPSTAIQNILARVTGNNPSQILGTLGIFGNSNPNLFLINPNGILFGSGASLDVGGSFVATTANAIAFGNQGIFSASAPNLPPLLTVNPSAFLFNQIPTQPITHQSSLRVPDGQSLLLLGGDVRLESGDLLALGGRIELGGLADVGAVGLLVDGNTLRLNFPNGVARADVSLTGTPFVSVAAGGGGSIAVNARNLKILGSPLGKSLIFAGIVEGAGTVDARAGDITVNTTGEIKIAGAGSGIANNLERRAVGKAGSVNITTGSLSITDGASIDALTFGQGDAGNVNIHAATTISLDGFSNDNVSHIGSTVEAGATGRGGEINLIAGSLNLTNGAQINSTTYGQGKAGNVNINVRDTVSFDGVGSNGPTGVLSSVVGGGAVGNGGSINITTGSLFVTNGAAVNADTNGQGDAGNINITARDIVSFAANLSGRVSSAASEVNPGAIGNGGNITIKTRLLSLANGALLGTSTYNQGNAGNITVDTEQLTVRDGSQVAARTFDGSTGNAGSVTVTASDLVELSGTSADDDQTPTRLSFNTSGTGNAGDLRITTGRLIVRDGAQVLATTPGKGRAGTLDVNASNFVQVIGTSADGKPSSLLFDTSGSGNAGVLRITTGTLLVQDGAQVSASTSASGRAGTLSVKASDSVQVIGTSADGQTPSLLRFNTSSTGNAGDLTIDTKHLIVRDGAQVSASTSSVGQGGILNVKASDSVEVSGTSANGQTPSLLKFETSGNGNAGGIAINTGRLVVQNGGQISVSGTGTGASGDLDVNADSIFLNNQGQLIAKTASGEGGNIRLRVQDSVLMRYNSEISTEAGNSGNGGNINIEAGGFVLAILSENSDIVANAFQGRGGNASATATGVFGFRQFKGRRTPESDFTASSELGIDGVVTINTRDNPRVVALPQNVFNEQIVQVCPSGGKQVAQNEFIVTGRGGLPDNPGDTLSSDAVWTDLRTPTATSTIQGKAPVAVRANSAQPPIVEANGWVLNEKGEVVLTATAPTVTSHNPSLMPSRCPSENSRLNSQLSKTVSEH